MPLSLIVISSASFKICNNGIKPFHFIWLSLIKTLWNMAPFIPRIIEIKENIRVSMWFGSKANIVFGDGIFHIQGYS